MDSVRKIIHVDMDAFYASIEQRDHPQWKGKPIAVGGSGLRGVVAAASYEARKFGVRSAMPAVTARRLCPHLLFVKPRFDVYKEVSSQIRDVFFHYTDLVEPLSLDEAYLDVTYNKKGLPYATQVAKNIKTDILRNTRLTASAGVSFNKFLAKVASDVKKPNGLYVITPERANAFLEKLPIARFHGIGKVTARKMHALGVQTGEDLKGLERNLLIREFGKAGAHYYDMVRARDNRPVEPHRERKSVSVENTYSSDIHDFREARAELRNLIDQLVGRLERNRTAGRTVTLKIKYNDFNQVTRSHTGNMLYKNKEDIWQAADGMLSETELEKPVRLLGVGVTNLEAPERTGVQLTLGF